MLLGSMVVFAAPAARGANSTYTWTGGLSGQWDSPTNWNPNTSWTAFGTAALFNTSGAAVTVNSVTASQAIFGANTTVSGGTITLAAGVGNIIVNNATSATISSAVNIIAPASSNYWTCPSSGTLTIAGPVTDSVGHIFMGTGNYVLNSQGSINISGFALVVNDSASSTTFQQTGGLITDSRVNSVAVYMTQNGPTTYTMSGGSMVLPAVNSTLAIGDNHSATMTVNGAGAFVSTPILNLNVASGGNGGFYLQNGLVQVDSILQSNANFTLNFSGGSIQPVDNGTLAVLRWGSATAANNVTFLMSGSGATFSSTDAGGVGRTVQIYAPLSGSGTLTTVGNGTLVLLGTNTNVNYSGAISIQSGTVQVGNANSLANATGSVTLAGGTLDIKGLAPTTGAVVLTSGSIIDSAGGGVLKGTSYTLQSGTASAALGGVGTALTMAGPGVAVLAGANTYNGGTNVSGGTLQLNSSNSLVAANGLLTVTGGALDLNGNNATAAGLTGTGGVVTASLPGTLTLAPTAATVYSGNIAGAAGITLNASHVLQTLAGGLTYTGATAVTAGTLSVTGGNALSTSPLIAVSPTAVLDVSQLPGGLAVTGGTLSGGRTSSPGVDINGNAAVNNSLVVVAGGSAGTLTIGGGLSVAGGTESFFPGDQIVATGALTLSGTDYVMPSVPLSAGVYTLFVQSGGLTGGPQNMAMAGLFGSSPRQSYVFGHSGPAITLTVSGTAANLVWTGSASNSWDNGVSANWNNTASNSPDKFFPADNVTFNDTAGAAGNVVINGGALGSVQPGSVVVSNTALNYTFSGTGSIGGTTSLVKNGPGGLTINTSNSYGGGTFLNGGVLTAGSNGALGTGALTISGGTLNSNAIETYAGGTHLSGGLLNLGNSAALSGGPLTITGGSLDNTSGAAMTLAGNIAQNWIASFTFVGSNPLNLGTGAVTLGITPTVTVGGSTLTVGGGISGNYGLSLRGAGTLNLGGANTYVGNTTINSGVLQLGTSSAIPTGAVAGNVVFSNSAASAVLDLNGNNATINGLSQPTLSASNTVINSLSGGTVTLTVGNNNATSTFGGVLANNTGTGGVLALAKTGAGTLTLMGNESYSGATTIGSGVLQLGTGVLGQDASIASTAGLVNNGSLIVSNAGPTTLPVPITGAGSLVMNSSNTLTLTGQNTVAALAFTNSGTITGGSISLTAGTTLSNAAGGLTTLASPLNIVGVGANNIWTGTSTGTLNIAAPITDSNNHLYLHDGNYVMGGAGSITVSGFALVLGGTGVNDTGAHTSTFLQTGGVLSASRPSAPANTFFVSQGGTTNYTMTGGTLLVTTGTGSVAYNGTNKSGNWTINGASAVASLAGLDLFGVSGGVAQVNLINGTLQVDYLFTNAAASSTAYDIFNLSGGTLQPLDGNVSSGGFGSATATQNLTIALSGSGATISSSDAGGIGRTVSVYVNLSGSGAWTATGAGTLVLQGSNSSFTGQVAISGGIVQIGAASTNALGSTAGSVLINGGLLDINGNSSVSPGPVTLASGGIVDSAGVGVLNAPSYALQSGTVSAVLGGATAPLNKTTSGLVLLTAANTYGGPTAVGAGTLALGQTGTLGPGNVTVSPGAVLDVSAWNPAGGYSFNGVALTAGRTGPAATDINGSFSLSNGTLAVISPTASGSLTVSGSMNLSGNDVYPYVPGNLIAVQGALTFSNGPTLLIPSTSLAQGAYTLMTYTGGAPDPASYMAMGGSYQSGTRQIFTFGTSGGTAVTLSVVGTAGNLVWNTSSGTWDVQNTASWFNNNTSSADVFYQADNVTLNDRPGGNAAIVNITTAVSPALMTVSNTAVNYTINGSGSINGSGALVKNGRGTVTINTNNSYSGGTTLNAGLLNLGTDQAIGLGALTINGGSLGNTSGQPMTLNVAVNINGGFTLVGGNPLTLGQPVTLGTTPVVTVGSGGTLTVQATISGNYGLSVAGPGMFVLAGPNNYTGNTTITQGVLQVGYYQGAIPNGPGAGNVVFSSAANSAVLDLNGNPVTVNGLSQPTVSTTNMVVSNQGVGTLIVGNNNASSTYGGVLADNNNAQGGQLNLQKIGAGTLALIASNTYSGATTINGGTLQLGDGTPGHDGSINQTNGIANNSTLAFDFFAPQTVSPAISGSGVIAQTGPGAVALSGLNTANFMAIAGNGAINAAAGGGTLQMQSPSNGPNTQYIALSNTATGVTTLGVPLNMVGGRQDWTGGSGTLNIEAPITQNTSNFFIDNGNYTLGNSGSINMPTGAYALVLNGQVGSTTNFLQTGGSVSVNRTASENVFYMTQGGTTNYTITGGAISVTSSTNGYGRIILGGFNANTVELATLTINGPTALVATPEIDLNYGNITGGPISGGTVNLVNGTLETDSIFTSGPNSAFFFSGGTLQPQDSAVYTIVGNGWGEPGFNINITLSGSGAVMSSTDASGNPQPVPVYANLVGSGGVNFTGSGTLQLLGTTSNYSGGSFINSAGTIQVGSNTAFGTGSVRLTSGTIDLAGFSPTIGGLLGATGGLIANLSGTRNSTLTVSPTGSSTFAGTIADGATNTTALMLSGSGTQYLTGTNTYTGGTWVEGNASLIVTSPQAIADGTNLYIGNGVMASATVQSSTAVAAVPEPGTLALLAAGAAAAVLARWRNKRPVRRIIGRASKAQASP
jgi:autotransporter-associated beta strand protein